MSKVFNTEFERLESAPGMLDMAVRINVNNGDYEFSVEENGLPTTLPYYQFVGVMQMLITHASERFWRGYPEKEEA